MKEDEVDNLVADWDDVYKKGQLSVWILLAIFEGKKYSAQINEFMYDATAGRFEVKEQSLYRALRRFSDMGLVSITEEQSPNSGPKRKYYQLTEGGEKVLGKFLDLNITPLLRPKVTALLERAIQKGK
jgi:DNA-binding PadR family transcriptional regulator